MSHQSECGNDAENYTETCVGGACEEGEWSIWLQWSRCECESDQQFRRRYCNGKTCTGSSYETRNCDRNARIICRKDSSKKIQEKKIGTMEKQKLANLIENDTNAQNLQSQKDRNVGLIQHQRKAEAVTWTSWTGWSVCDCYTGRSYRQRMCASPRPPAIFIHSHCPGQSISEADCQPINCNEIPGGWSGWSEWSDCPQNCGLGCQYRVRMCAHSMPINGGSSCSGNSRELRLCPIRDCAGQSRDGEWSPWSEWSECSATCGVGHQARSRHCTSPFPSNGGEYCIGSSTDTRPCDTFLDCPQMVAGGWSSWTEWSLCDGRNRLSWRFCNEPQPRGVYSRCHGRARRKETCTTVKQ